MLDYLNIGKDEEEIILFSTIEVPIGVSTDGYL